MALPDDYLRYDRRRRGQDHDRYDFALAKDKSPARLPDGKKLAVAMIVPLEWFMLNPSGKPFKHPGAMQTPYPDLRHFTTRDYGNRVGVFRILDALSERGLKATFAANAALLERAAPLIDAIDNEGHEVAAHGLDTDSIHWSGRTRSEEERLIETTRHAFERRGLSPRAWMSPARQQSFATPDLIRAAGFDICLDWEVDDVPTPMRTSAGSLIAFPVFNELDDRLLLTTKNHSEEDWRAQIEEAVDFMKSEHARFGAKALGIALTPYIIGQPFRMQALGALLDRLAADGDLLIGGVSQLSDAFSAS